MQGNGCDHQPARVPGSPQDAARNENYRVGHDVAGKPDHHESRKFTNRREVAARWGENFDERVAPVNIDDRQHRGVTEAEREGRCHDLVDTVHVPGADEAANEADDAEVEPDHRHE